MVEVEFSKKAEKTYQQLRKSKLSEDVILITAINNKVELMKIDPQIGDKVKKKQIPLNLDLDNLFRVTLPCYWRMLYTLKKDKLEIIALVIDIVNHTKYNRKMKY